MIKRVLDIVGSFGLACILFLLLLLLTFLGTLYQVDHGLYEAQKLYFDSIYVIHYFFDVIPAPLPGVFLLMCILAVNLIIGGFVRMRKDWKRAGVLIIHIGILIMLAGGLVKRVYATEGNIALFEGQSSSTYESYMMSEIVITEANAEGDVTQFAIPESDLRSIGESASRSFSADGLPFTFVIEDYMPNCQPIPAGAPMATNRVVDGVTLHRMPRDKQAEANLPGAYVRATNVKGGEDQEGIIWSDKWWQPVVPWIVKADGREFAVEIRRQQWEVPFVLKLDDFQMEKHPGTQMAARYSSYVTKSIEDVDQNIHITMNAPLRYDGYTVYQESWGPSNAKPGDPLYSQFRVVRNPSDQWPLYSCIVISIGLVFHFSIKLSGYLRAEAKRAQA